MITHSISILKAYIEIEQDSWNKQWSEPEPEIDKQSEIDYFKDFPQNLTQVEDETLEDTLSIKLNAETGQPEVSHV